MKIPATLELRGSWTVVTDARTIDMTGTYVLAVAGSEVEYLYIDGRYMGEVMGSTPSVEYFHAHGLEPSALVTERSVHMMLHTHQEDDPRNRPQ